MYGDTKTSKDRLSKAKSKVMPPKESNKARTRALSKRIDLKKDLASYMDKHSSDIKGCGTCGKKNCEC